MQYAVLIYETSEAFAQRGASERDAYVAAWRTYYESLVAAGIYAGGEPLQGPETATLVKMRSGKRQIQDGPYANTKEQLGGFILLELPSLDAALEWASRCPAAAEGAVEVRPLASVMKQTIENQGEVPK